MGWRTQHAPRSGASRSTWLITLATIVVVLAVLLYAPLASDAPLRDSTRVSDASFTVTTPVVPGTDQRGIAATVAPSPGGDTVVREWSASAPVDVVASGGTAVNLPAGLSITAVGWSIGDRGSEVDDDGFVRVAVAAADAERLGLAEGDTLSVTGTGGTQRLRVADTVLPPDRDVPGPADDGSLAVGVSPVDLPRFSGPAVLGWTITWAEFASAGAARAGAEDVAAFAGRLEDAGAAPGGTTTTGDLPAILTEAAAAYRVAVNLSLNGAVLVALAGAGLVTHLRLRRVGDRAPGGTGRLVPGSVVVLAVVLAVVPPILLGERNGIPPLSLAPAALIGVGALATAVLVPRAALLLGRRGGALRPHVLIGSRGLARRPGAWYAPVFAVVLAVGASGSGAVVVGSTTAATTAAASLANGGDVRVVGPSGAGSAGLDAVSASLPDGARSLRVFRVPAELGGTATEVVAVNSSALPGVLPSGNGVDAERLADDLRPRIPAPEPALDLQPTARQVRFQLTTSPIDAGGGADTATTTAQVSAWLEREDGALQRVPAGTLVITPPQVQQHSLSFTLPEGLRAEAIAAIDMSLVSDASGTAEAAGPGFTLEVVSTSTDAAISTGGSRFAPGSTFSIEPSLPGVGEAGVTDLGDGAGFTVTSVPPRAAAPLTVRLLEQAGVDALPVAASSGTPSDALDVRIYEAPVSVVVAAVEPALPGTGEEPALLTDLRAASYALLRTAAGPPEPSEVWLAGADVGAIERSVEANAPPGTLTTTAELDPLGAPLAPLAWVVMIACAIAALGVLALTARSRGSSGDGRDADVLAMLGIPGTTAAAAHRWALVAVVVMSLVLGLLVAALAVVVGEGPATGLRVHGPLIGLVSPDPTLTLASAVVVVLIVVLPLVVQLVGQRSSSRAESRRG